MSGPSSDEIRARFLRFFEERGHLVLPSASLLASQRDMRERMQRMLQSVPLPPGASPGTRTSGPPAGRCCAALHVSVSHTD